MDRENKTNLLKKDSTRTRLVHDGPGDTVNNINNPPGIKTTVPLIKTDLDAILEIIRASADAQTRLDAATSLFQYMDDIEPLHPSKLQELYEAEKDMRVAAEIKRLINKVQIRRIMENDPTEPYDRHLTSEEEENIAAEIKKIRSLYDRTKQQDGAFESTYKIIGLLGKGGMASIFKAVRLADGKPVIIKMLTRERLAGGHDAEMMIARFQRESDLLVKRLKHPHVIEAYDQGNSKEEYYIILEYVEGGDLSDMLKLRPLSFPEFRVAMRQLCDAVEYIHSMDVIHRDINPNNIMMFKSDGSIGIKLADFGLAMDKRDTRKLTQINVGMGTDGFISPQQYKEASLSDERDDIYSLGKTFYQMLAGHEQKDNADYQPLTLDDVSVSQTINDVILKCIRPEKKDRWQNIGELRRALENVL